MIKQVAVSNAVVTILTPSQKMKVGTIQNNGATAVRISIDGGAGYTDARSGDTGTDPSTTTGIRIAAGKELAINTLYGDAGLHKPIVGISEGSSVTLDVATDDANST